MEQINNPNTIKKVFLCYCFECGPISWFKDKDKYFCINKNTKVFFIPDVGKSKLDGPAKIDLIDKNFRLFYINGSYYMPTVFARKTNHIICDYCNTFCNQECFIIEK